jgi:hypothetical protein
VNQLVIERHHVDTNDPQSSSQAHYTNETRTSEVPDDLILGNHDTSNGIEEIFINYTSSGEVYDHNTQTYASQLLLLKISLVIQILRPWQSVRNARIGISGKKQLRLA